MNTKLREIHLKGMPLSKGIAIGTPFYIDIPEDPIPEYSVAEHQVEDEILRYHAAVKAGQLEIQRLQGELVGKQDEEAAAILDTHLHIMQDSVLTVDVENEIRRLGKNAEYVFHGVMKRFQKKFSAIKDPFFLDRLKDIRDVSRRLLGRLRKDVRSYFQEIPPQAIIFTRELSPSDVVEASALSVAGFVTQAGGAASHAAIVSKAKGIPLISSINLNEVELPLEGIAIVDGNTGDIIINPSASTLADYARLKEQENECLKHRVTVKGVKAETYDGYAVSLSANISMVDELALLHEYGVNAVGLFRSEYVFLSDEDFPDEEKQFQTYKQIVKEMKGLPIVIRVFDLGGDKYMLGQKTPYESNPFLGCRAIRFLLRERHLFKSQLKAILRASAYGNVSIMIPMVTTLVELQEAKSLLEEARLELQLIDGIAVRQLRIGCMIEVPSAALIADLLAKECDFLSIGTNDLVQYCLAADRGNHSLSRLYCPAHPAILRLIKHVVIAANNAGIPVSICGEIAADPRFTVLLLGLGISELSVSLCHYHEIKCAIRNCSIVEAVRFSEKILHLKTAEEIDQRLTNSPQIGG